MPFHNAHRHHGRVWSLVLLPLIATCFAPAALGATESVPRACDDMSYKAIAKMMDAASEFETRLVLLGKSLVQENSAAQLADTEDGSRASNREEINVGTLRNSLAEVWGYLAASENLAAAKDLMVDGRDRATLDRQLNLVAERILEPLSFGLETADNVTTMTKHPAIAAEVAKIHEFLDDTRTRFTACAGGGNHGRSE